MLVKVLGTGQDGGVPHVACFCDNCNYARDNAAARRRGPSLGIVDPESGAAYLIDASPDFPAQLVTLRTTDGVPQKGTRFLPDGIFLTHGHFGHYWGLGYLGKEACAPRELPVYGTPQLTDYLRANRPFRDLVQAGNLVLKELADGVPVRLSSHLSVTPLRVPHRQDVTDTVGFRVKGEHRELLYIPDMDDYTAEILRAIESVDLAFLDGCFYAAAEVGHRDIKEIPHPFIPYSMERLAGLHEKTDIYFTHFNHTNYVLRPDGEAKRRVLAAGFHILEDGMVFVL